VARAADVRAALAAPAEVGTGWIGPFPATRDDGRHVRMRMSPETTALTTLKTTAPSWSDMSGTELRLRLRLVDDERYRDTVDAVSFLGPEGRWLFSAGGIAAGVGGGLLVIGAVDLVVVGALSTGLDPFERAVVYAYGAVPVALGLAALVTGAILAYIGHGKMVHSEELAPAPPARPAPDDESGAGAIGGEEGE
jgi:hypothetical protein